MREGQENWDGSTLNIQEHGSSLSEAESELQGMHSLRASTTKLTIFKTTNTDQKKKKCKRSRRMNKEIPSKAQNQKT